MPSRPRAPTSGSTTATVSWSSRRVRRAASTSSSGLLLRQLGVAGAGAGGPFHGKALGHPAGRVDAAKHVGLSGHATAHVDDLGVAGGLEQRCGLRGAPAGLAADHQRRLLRVVGLHHTQEVVVADHPAALSVKERNVGRPGRVGVVELGDRTDVEVAPPLLEERGRFGWRDTLRHAAGSSMYPAGCWLYDPQPNGVFGTAGLLD